MKKIIFTPALLLFTTFVFTATFTPAQNPKKSINSIDTLTFTKGSLLKKESIEIGRESNFIVKAVHSTNIATKEKTKYIQIEITKLIHEPIKGGIYYDQNGLVASPEAGYNSTIVLTINNNEIDELIRWMQFIKDEIFPMKAANISTVYSYKGNSGFEIGCYSDYWADGARNQPWRGYLKSADYFNDEDNYSQTHFITLLTLLKQAKEKLQ